MHSTDISLNLASPVALEPAIMPDSVALIVSARSSLAQARALPDIVRVLEQASLLTDIAKRAAKFALGQKMAADAVREAEAVANDAAAIRIEAQAKGGELLQRMAESGERVTRGSPGMKAHDAPSLSDLGVSRIDSQRWQTVAAVPEPVRAEYVERTKAVGGEVTTAGLIRHHAEQARSTDRVTAEHDQYLAAARRYNVRLSEIAAVATAITVMDPTVMANQIDPAVWEIIQRLPRILTEWVERAQRERGNLTVVK